MKKYVLVLLCALGTYQIQASGAGKDEGGACRTARPTSASDPLDSQLLELCKKLTNCDPCFRSVYSNQIKEVIQKGANPNLQDRLDNTVLHYASFLGLEDLTGFLLASRADTTLKNVYKLTPYGLTFHESIKELICPSAVKKAVLKFNKYDFSESGVIAMQRKFREKHKKSFFVKMRQVFSLERRHSLHPLIDYARSLAGTKRPVVAEDVAARVVGIVEKWQRLTSQNLVARKFARKCKSARDAVAQRARQIEESVSMVEENNGCYNNLGYNNFARCKLLVEECKQLVNEQRDQKQKREAAVVKLQSLQRGRAARVKAARLKKFSEGLLGDELPEGFASLASKGNGLAQAINIFGGVAAVAATTVAGLIAVKNNPEQAKAFLREACSYKSQAKTVLGKMFKAAKIGFEVAAKKGGCR